MVVHHIGIAACFSIGCKHRMGQDWRPNQAMSTDLLSRYLSAIEFKIMDATTFDELNVIGAYSVVTYVISLGGSEGFLLDLGGLRKHGFPQILSKIFF
jgi:hypothetical protein